MIDKRSGSRGDPQDVAGLRRQPLLAGQHQVLERLRDHRDVAVAAVRELLDEERDALAALPDPRDRPRRQLASDLADHEVDLGIAETLQRDPVRQRQPADLPEPGEQRVAAMHLVLAVGEHEQDPAVADGAQQEAQQVAGGRVRPVQVLDDDDQRLGRGEALDQGRHGLEQPATPQRISGGRGAKLGDQAGKVGPSGTRQLGELVGPEVGDQRAEHRREGGERGSVRAELQAVPDQHPRSRGDGGRELGDEP